MDELELTPEQKEQTCADFETRQKFRYNAGKAIVISVAALNIIMTVLMFITLNDIFITMILTGLLLILSLLILPSMVPNASWTTLAVIACVIHLLLSAGFLWGFKWVKNIFIIDRIISFVIVSFYVAMHEIRILLIIYLLYSATAAILLIKHKGVDDFMYNRNIKYIERVNKKGNLK